VVLADEVAQIDVLQVGRGWHCGEDDRGEIPPLEAGDLRETERRGNDGSRDDGVPDEIAPTSQRWWASKSRRFDAGEALGEPIDAIGLGQGNGRLAAATAVWAVARGFDPEAGVADQSLERVLGDGDRLDLFDGDRAAVALDEPALVDEIVPGPPEAEPVVVRDRVDRAGDVGGDRPLDERDPDQHEEGSHAGTVERLRPPNGRAMSRTNAGTRPEPELAPPKKNSIAIGKTAAPHRNEVSA